MSDEIPEWAQDFILVKEIRGPIDGTHLVVDETGDSCDLVARDESEVYARWTFLSQEEAVNAFNAWPQYPGDQPGFFA